MSRDAHEELTVLYVEEHDRYGVSKGYRGTCLCGWESSLCGKVEQIGAEFDEHLTDIQLLPPDAHLGHVGDE